MTASLTGGQRPRGAGAIPAVPLSRTLGLAGAYAAALAIALYPLFLVEIPGLVDYPNHLARIYVLAEIGGDPDLREIYEIRWAILPNLAMDVVALPLAWILPVYDAGRIFIGLTLVMIVAGTATLFRVLHGRFGIWPVLTTLFLYNYLLFWGFLNFLFAVGVFLFAFSAWIAGEKQSPWVRLAVFSVVTVLLFFCHLFALGIYAVAVAGYEFGKFRDGRADRELLRRWGPTAGQFVGPAVLWVLSPTRGGDSATGFGSAADKLDALISPLLFYGGLVDVIAGAAVVLVLCRAFIARDLVFDRRILIPVVALGIAAALTPNMLIGVWGADFRLPFVLVCLLIAGTRWTIKDRRAAALLVISAMTLSLVRTSVIAERWQQVDRDFAEFRQASEKIPRGSKVLAARVDPAGGLQRDFLSYWHMVSLAIVERSVFTPGFFSDPRKQPVLVREALRSIDATQTPPIAASLLARAADPTESERMRALAIRHGFEPFWANWPRNFDYVVVIHEGPIENPVPGHLERIHGSSFFDLYKVTRQAATGGPRPDQGNALP